MPTAVLLSFDQTFAKTVDVCATEDFNTSNDGQNYTVSGFVWDPGPVLEGSSSIWMTAKLMPKSAKKLGCSLWVSTRNYEVIPQTCVHGARVTVNGVWGYDGTDFGVINASMRCG